MKRVRRFFTPLVSLALLLSMSLPAFASSADHWAASVYEKWVEAGVISDTEDFAKIDAPVTRSALVQILDEVLDWSWDIMAENTFRDLIYLEDGTTYLSDFELYTDVLKAVGAGVIAGTPEHDILPFQPVSRQDACVILRQAFQLPAAEDAELFADDGEIADYAKQAVYAVSSLGYVTGKGGGNFDPQGTITYAELSIILNNLAADYPQVAQRVERDKTDWIYDKSTEITVATVDTYAGDTSVMIPDSLTYEGGWVETNSAGEIITPATGTKDLNIRLWVPEGTQPGDDLPVLLYTFGGSWIRGDNTSIDPMMVEYMVENGVAVAALTYRYEHEACFPYPLYDLQAQIRYLKINAHELGLDADNMGVTGNSAGGYWAAELAVTGNEAELQDPGYVTFEGDRLGMLTTIDYCGCMYGCFNMMNCADYVDYRIQDYQAAQNQHSRPISNDPNVMGTAAAGYSTLQIVDAYENGTDDPDLAVMVQRFVDGSPIFWVDADDPSFFFYHGTADALCPINQATEMFGTLCAAGVDNCVFRVCEGMGHGSSKQHLQYYQEMLEWMLERAAE